MSDAPRQGFLGRWSRLKTTSQKNVVTDAPKAASQPDTTAPAPLADLARPSETQPASPQAPATPPPSLQDVAQLTPESDFRAFVARDVASDVKNAAMKKLFADPHFNVMDRMDVYIDDYSQPDPLSPALLRQMASAQFLNLTEEEAAPAVESSDKTVAQSVPPSSSTSEATHDHADLRLQPNPASGQQGAGTKPV
jgi:hypothetical protein